jgi:lipopolysaccharide/colanic/teichoic acid biosynthesis glycosyltransferase
MSRRLSDAQKRGYSKLGMPVTGRRRIQRRLSVREAPNTVHIPGDLASLPALLVSKQCRALDILLSSIMLILLAPLMLLIAVAVRLSSPGPALFRQVRVGFRGETFELLKFRTMRQDNDDSIHRQFVTKLLSGIEPAEGSGKRIYKLERDPRVTMVGRILRRLSLDELPQLINVLFAEMSLVGPRPALSWEVELFDPIYVARYLVPPGMTGLWQVSGRNKLSITEGLDLDLEYVRRQSFGLYVLILLKTIPTIVMGNGAS